jgi:hypothetical protein
MSEQTGNQNKKYITPIIRLLMVGVVVAIIVIFTVVLEHNDVISFDGLTDAMDISRFVIYMLMGVVCTYGGISLIVRGIIQTVKNDTKMYNITENKVYNITDKRATKYMTAVFITILGMWIIFNQLQIYNVVEFPFSTFGLLLYLFSFVTALLLWLTGYGDTKLLNRGICRLSDLEKIRARCALVYKCIEGNKEYYSAIYEYSVSCENLAYADRKKYKENNKPEINSYIEIYYSRDKKKAVTRGDFYKGIRYMIYGVVILLVTVCVGINVGV